MDFGILFVQSGVPEHVQYQQILI